jgi:hypothetical protein
MLDIRTPIGLMFLIMGLILVAWGLISNPEIYFRSLGINVNLLWGFVLVAFGSIMTGMAWKASKKKD